jgi:hypothetical protein
MVSIHVQYQSNSVAQACLIAVSSTVYWGPQAARDNTTCCTRPGKVPRQVARVEPCRYSRPRLASLAPHPLGCIRFSCYLLARKRVRPLYTCPKGTWLALVTIQLTHISLGRITLSAKVRVWVSPRGTICG